MNNSIILKFKKMSSNPKAFLEFFKNNCDEEAVKLVYNFTDCRLRTFFEMPGRIGISMGITEILHTPCKINLFISAIYDEQIGLVCMITNEPPFGQICIEEQNIKTRRINL